MSNFARVMSNKTNLTFVMNPISGTVKKAGIPDIIAETLDHDRFSYRIAWTEYAGHAEVIAREEVEAGTDIVVAVGGDGTRRLGLLQPGQTLNCVLPLGNGFTLPAANGANDDAAGNVAKGSQRSSWLLIGGGVGVAPLLYLGATLQQQAVDVTFLLGGRTAQDLLELDLFSRYGRVCITTEDGSAGEQGFVTNHSVLGEHFDRIATCGPTPMMKAVARYARERAIDCEASLENLMACGLGACLCCVEKTTEGNLCVCKDGPVFDTRRLLWT